MTPYKHALSSVKQWGGSTDDYIAIHQWFDTTKANTGDFTHRALRHHAFGIEECIEKFGHSIPTTTHESHTGGQPAGKQREPRRVSVKEIAERHVIEDCGFIPTVADWLRPIKANPPEWMLKVKTTTSDLMQIDEETT